MVILRRDEINELRGVVYMIKSRGREQILARRHKTDIEIRETTFTYHTERTRGLIRFEPVLDSQDSASYSKPRGKTRQ